MKALYRKYRPLDLAEVVGQDQVTKPLANSLKNGKINHAYLFIGPRGCGKTSVARILAHKVNNFDYIAEDSYVDIIEIDGASNRGIDDIRELREKAAIAPTIGKYKVYIIDEVHMLTPPAFNALLKTLEEPPRHVIFILATTDAHKVPITITSRTQVYTFKLLATDEMQKFLTKIASQEKLAIEDEALKIIARRGGGSFRDSLSLLDQISSLSNKKITKEMVIAALGLPDDDKIETLLQEYQTGNLEGITTTLKDLTLSGIKPEIITEELIKSIIKNPNPPTLPLLEKLSDVKPPFPEARLLVALTSNLTTSQETRPVPQIEPKKKATAAKPSAVPKIEPSQKSRPNTPGPEGREITTPAPSVTPTNFDWQNFLDQVKVLNDAMYSQLQKCEFSFNHHTLELYPKRKIVKAILSRDNNRAILSQALPGNKIIVHEVNEQPRHTETDATINKLSDIMGGEVRNDIGGNPFE